MNSSKTRDPRQELSDELAESLRDDKGRRALRLLQTLGWLREDPPSREKTEKTPPSERTPLSPSPDVPKPISIWLPREIDGELCFERPAPMLLGDHYAANRWIKARKTPGTSRLVFFGESVAAGYLYAPHLTPAQMLDVYLRESVDGRRFEVVDLARTNESLGPLTRTLEASLQLEPDLFVLFIGNNWNLLETPEASPQVPSIRARQGAALALRQGGMRGLIERAKRQIAASARFHLQQIAELTRGKRVVVVLPEVNLLDWKNRQPVPWLPGEAVGLWYMLHDEGFSSLENRKPEAARIAAQKMIELDQGLCPTSYRLLGKALLALGHTQEARRAFESEVDANAYASQAFLGAPQATTQARQLLMEAARAHGWTLVDLRQVFADANENGLPGRDLFLDYCHLSSVGMHQAMAAIAASVVDHPIAPQPSLIHPTAEHEALACLGAAIHTAHRLVGTERQSLIEYWCRRALDHSPSIADTLREVIAVRCSGTPAVLHAAQQRNLNSPYPLLLQHGWRWEHLDAEVLLAIRDALTALDPTIEQKMTRQLAKQHSGSWLELTRAPYLWQPLERLYPEVMEVADLHGRAFYRALWPKSSFCLISDAQSEIALQITARLPQIEGAPERLSRRVRVRVNGIAQADFQLDSHWQRHALRFPATACRPGLNRLTLHWPPPQPAGEIALELAIRRLEEGLDPDLHPIFGELFALRARTS